MEEEREKGWQKDGRREGRRKGNSPLENINQEQRARKENWNRYIKSNIPWSPGSRNLRIDAWCVVLVQQKAPEMKKRLAVAVCLEKNIVFVFVLSTRGYSMYLGRKSKQM
jgi:hypothetical protein